MNTENQNTEVPAQGDNDGADIQSTITWIVNTVLKDGAAYLADVILNALGL